MTFKVVMYEVEETEADQIAYNAAKTCMGFVGAFISDLSYNEEHELVSTLELYFETEKDVMLFNLRNR